MKQFHLKIIIKLFEKCCCICHDIVIKLVERKINKHINNKRKNTQEVKVQHFSVGNTSNYHEFSKVHKISITNWYNVYTYTQKGIIAIQC